MKTKSIENGLIGGSAIGGALLVVGGTWAISGVGWALIVLGGFLLVYASALASISEEEGPQ